jgi:hypothetical protein
LSKIICGPLQRGLEFFHRIGMTAVDRWRMIRAGSDLTIFGTVWRRSWFASVKLTLQFYSHAVSQNRMAATGEMLTAILSHAVDQSGLKAD